MPTATSGSRLPPKATILMPSDVLMVVLFPRKYRLVHNSPAFDSSFSMMGSGRVWDPSAKYVGKGMSILPLMRAATSASSCSVAVCGSAKRSPAMIACAKAFLLWRVEILLKTDRNWPLTDPATTLARH